MTAPDRGFPFAFPRRRALVGMAGAMTFPWLRPAQGATGAPPYPWASRRLTRVDDTWLWRAGGLSDQWVHGAIDDSRIMAAWGDGFGWSRQSGEAKSYLGVTEIGGAVTSPSGSDLWGTPSRPLKPCALVANNGDPIMYVVSDEDGRDGSYLMQGSFDGRSWSAPSGPVLSRAAHGLVVVGTADRPARTNGSEIALYLAADGNLKGAALSDRPRNSEVYLAFVTRNKLSSTRNWVWYAGPRNGNHLDPVRTTRAPWVDDPSRPAPVPAFVDPAGAGKHFLVSWCASANLFVGVKTHSQTGLGVFVAPRIWGPWATAWYDRLIPTDGTIFTAKAVSMWSTGSTVAVMWSGGPETDPSIDYDAVYLTRFSF